MDLSPTDRLDILDLLTRADSAASRRDADAYVTLFTDDALLEGKEGNYEGKKKLRESVGPIWNSEGPVSMHLTLNPVVSALEGHPDEAVADSTLVILSVGTAISIRSVSNIVQHVAKVGDTWLIKRRTVVSNFVSVS